MEVFGFDTRPYAGAYNIVLPFSFKNNTYVVTGNHSNSENISMTLGIFNNPKTNNSFTYRCGESSIQTLRVGFIIKGYWK